MRFGKELHFIIQSKSSDNIFRNAMNGNQD